jgi:hypothetical protein
MKRSVLFAALFLALAGAPACGGGMPGTDGGSDSGSGDPVADIKNMSDGIQKEIDEIFAPIKNADAVIDSVAKLPADLKATVKGKLDAKKLMAAAKGIVDGGEFNPDALGLEGEAKTMATERLTKLKELVTSIKTMDEKVKALGQKVTDAVTKIPGLGVSAIAKLELTMKNPLAGADAKKKAEEDKKTLEGIVSGFKDKAAGWQKDITEMPAKAKDLPAKMAKAFSG